MALKAYLGPLGRGRSASAGRASAPPFREPSYTQGELRARRRRGLLTANYGSDWSLNAEVAAICTPLADRIVVEPCPAGYLGAVDLLAEKVHAVVLTAVALVARADAECRTRMSIP